MKRLLTRCFVIICTGALLYGCNITKPYGDNNGRDIIDGALSDSIQSNAKHRKTAGHNSQRIPEQLTQALMPEMQLPISNKSKTNNTKVVEPKFDIAVNNVPAKEFFMGLVKGTKYNIAVDPQITGNISLNLKSVTIPQAMDIVRDTYGFEYEATSYGYKIFPRRLETRIFHVNYIDVERIGHSQTSVGSGQITNTIQNTLTASGVSSSNQAGSMPGGLINTSSNSKFWELLQQNLETIVGTQDGRSIVVNARSGAVIAKAYPNELRAIGQYLDSIQNIVNRQVIIEAKVLEVRLDAKFQSGINWKVLGLNQGFANSVGADGNIINANTDLIPGFNGFAHITATDRGAFSSVIDLLNTQGDVNVLSSPRIATINNQKAVIKVGVDRFFITNITSNTHGSGADANTSSAVTLTPFFSGISLDVTPQIDENDFVTIHIHPVVSEVVEDKRVFRVDNKEQSLPLARSTVKESDSIVRAKSGQVIVLGGLMENSEISIQNSTPGTEKIPIVNGLFKNNNLTSKKYELVILLRPIIAEDIESWQKQLREAADNIKKNREGFGYNLVPAKQKDGKFVNV
jgi:MSHA biogenesis protein MshL